jgi:sorbitol/mannitol transport system permease protein
VISVPASSKGKRPTPWVHYLQNAVLYLAVAVIFGPIFWLIVTGFKTNAAAYTLPPRILFTPTLEQYASALQGF